jgi:hypothetical protein
MHEIDRIFTKYLFFGIARSRRISLIGALGEDGTAYTSFDGHHGVAGHLQGANTSKKHPAQGLAILAEEVGSTANQVWCSDIAHPVKVAFYIWCNHGWAAVRF